MLMKETLIAMAEPSEISRTRPLDCRANSVCPDAAAGAGGWSTFVRVSAMSRGKVLVAPGPEHGPTAQVTGTSGLGPPVHAARRAARVFSCHIQHGFTRSHCT